MKDDTVFGYGPWDDLPEKTVPNPKEPTNPNDDTVFGYGPWGVPEKGLDPVLSTLTDLSAITPAVRDNIESWFKSEVATEVINLLFSLDAALSEAGVACPGSKNYLSEIINNLDYTSGIPNWAKALKEVIELDLAEIAEIAEIVEIIEIVENIKRALLLIDTIESISEYLRTGDSTRLGENLKKIMAL